MSRHYSTKDFLRQMPNALLARYFQARGLFGDLDFSAMKETHPDQLFVSWLSRHPPDDGRVTLRLPLSTYFGNANSSTRVLPCTQADDIGAI
jgi:hypothetical protein